VSETKVHLLQECVRRVEGRWLADHRESGFEARRREREADEVLEVYAKQIGIHEDQV